MNLSRTEKKRFRSIGHQLKPVVIIAQNGLTENVVREIDRALNDHELIKVKVQVADRTDKQELISQLCQRLSAQDVQSIGHKLLLYRAALEPNTKLSNLRYRPA
ncbi:MAG: ribosome assembly RNA-binding protein YhbY [Gammaproteobacteria bacterium]|nr:ribosome assembly RNA-binding protein YhbY [Gammaproteobacteria bacterium]